MKKRTLGIVLLTLSWVLFPLTLVGYAVFNFMLAQSGADGESLRVVTTVVNISLGLLGVLSIFLFVAGIPIGLYLISRKDEAELAVLRSNPRFKDLSDEDFRFVTGWSWGAFFGSVVWALGNKLWLWALGALVPIWNVFVWVKLAADGRQTAWASSTETIAAFRTRQKVVAWVIAGLIVLAIVAGFARSAKQVADMRDFVSPKQVACAAYADADGDDIPDGHEKDFGTDPTLVDTDADGFSDYAELLGGYEPNDGSVLPDADADGLADERERTFYGSNPKNSDSDDDGVSDLDEVRAGLDPDGTGNMKRVQAMYQLKISVNRKDCQE